MGFSEVEYEYTISDVLYNIFKKKNQTASSKLLRKERENWKQSGYSVLSDFGMLKTLLFRYLNS